MQNDFEGEVAIVANDNKGTLTLRIVAGEEARRLAKKEGG